MISTNIKNLHSNFCISLLVEICHSPYCQSYNSNNVNSENYFSIGSTNYPQIDIFLYSHHLPARYCIDIVRRNYVLVMHGSYPLPVDQVFQPTGQDWSKNEGSTHPQLSELYPEHL